MSDPEKLQIIMTRKRLRDLDVASRLKISPTTVRKYLRGAEVRPLIDDTIRAFIAANESTVTKPPESPPAA